MIQETRYNASKPLHKGHDRSSFDCGVEPLNDYLKRYALQNQKRDAARTYVVTSGEQVVGYYTLVFAGLRAFMIHAKDESAKNFYQKLGFISAPHNEFHLFMKMSDIKESLNRQFSLR